MDERSVLKVLTQLDVEYKHTVNDWAMCLCPLAPWKFEHPKGYDSQPGFGVHIDEDDVSRYHCFTCKAKGTLGGLAMLLGKYRDEPELIALGKKIDQDDILGGSLEYEWADDKNTKGSTSYKNQTFPREATFESRFPRTLASPEASRYLRRRGISVNTAFSLGLRFDTAQRRILFPVYDYWTGSYAGCSGRSILKPAQLQELEQRTGRAQPKVRDYFGLEKDKVLLHRRGISRRARRSLSGNARTRSSGTNGPQYLIGVEGLFAFARAVECGYGNNAFALLGSELLYPKGKIIEDIGLPVFWFTDPDPAGQSCLYGRLDDAGEHSGKGALHMMFHHVAQFVPEWGDIEDPDDLSKDDWKRMIDEAELYVDG